MLVGQIRAETGHKWPEFDQISADGGDGANPISKRLQSNIAEGMRRLVCSLSLSGFWATESQATAHDAVQRSFGGRLKCLA